MLIVVYKFIVREINDVIDIYIWYIWEYKVGKLKLWVYMYMMLLICVMNDDLKWKIV